MSFGKVKWIMKCNKINATDDKKVKALEKSMMENGWVGMPVLYMDDILITGSHRLQALRNLEERYYDFTAEEKAQWERLTENDEATYEVDIDLEDDEEIEYDNLRKYFEGTEIEQWKDELCEW